MPDVDETDHTCHDAVMMRQPLLSTGHVLSPLIIILLMNASWVVNADRAFIRRHIVGFSYTNSKQQAKELWLNRWYHRERMFSVAHSRTTRLGNDGIDENKSADIGSGAQISIEEEEHDDEVASIVVQSNNPTKQEFVIDYSTSTRNIYPFEGSRTKFGKRQRNEYNRRSNNAHVRNSYLKLLFEDAVFDQLYHTTCQLKRQWEVESECTTTTKHAPLVVNDSTVGQPSQQPPSMIRSKKQSHRQVVTILPRSRSSLHMTYFFVGKVLDDMNGDDIQRWQSMIKECVTMDSLSEDDNKDYSLLFKSLTMFPPGKNNLLVATFDPSIALDRFYERFYHLAVSEKPPRTTTATSNCSTTTSATLEMKDYEFPLLRDLVLQQQKNRNQCTPSWLPHVTLASIVGGTKADRIAFGEWLNGKTLSLDIASDKNDGSASKNSDVMANLELRIGSIHALGVGLGGPIPDIRDLILDWNFPFFDDAMVDTTNSNENDKL